MYIPVHASACSAYAYVAVYDIGHVWLGELIWACLFFANLLRHSSALP